MNAKKTVEITFTILKFIGEAGMLATMLVLPQMAHVFAPIYKCRERTYHPYIATRAIQRLRSRGLVSIETSGGRSFYSLTEKGLAELNKFELRTYSIKRQKKWDGKWRTLVFDISEKKKFARERIRLMLKTLKFERLQDSVWIHPYPCEDLIELIRTAYGLRYDAVYLTANRFEYDNRYVRLFKLQN